MLSQDHCFETILVIRPQSRTGRFLLTQKLHFAPATTFETWQLLPIIPGYDRE